MCLCLSCPAPMGVVYIPAGRDASWILKSWQSPQLLLRLTQWPENKLPSLHPREGRRGSGRAERMPTRRMRTDCVKCEGESSNMESSSEFAEPYPSRQTKNLVLEEDFRIFSLDVYFATKISILYALSEKQQIERLRARGACLEWVNCLISSDIANKGEITENRKERYECAD